MTLGLSLSRMVLVIVAFAVVGLTLAPASAQAPASTPEQTKTDKKVSVETVYEAVLFGGGSRRSITRMIDRANKIACYYIEDANSTHFTCVHSPSISKD